MAAGLRAWAGSERGASEAGRQHCYLKAPLGCRRLQVTPPRRGRRVRAGTRGCGPGWNPPASEAAGGGWGSASAAGSIPCALARGWAPAGRRGRGDRSAGSRASSEARGTSFARDFGRERARANPSRVAGKERSGLPVGARAGGAPVGRCTFLPSPPARAPAQRPGSASSLLWAPGIAAAEREGGRRGVRRPSLEQGDLKEDFLSLSRAEREAFAFPQKGKSHKKP